MGERNDSATDAAAPDAPAGTAGDLARLRALAEAGRAQPLLGGRSLVAFGLAIALAAAFQAAVFARLVPLPGWTLALSWSAAMLAAGLLARPGPRRAAITIANRVEREVWRAGGTVLALAAFAILLFGMLRQDAFGPGVWAAFAAMPPLTFGVYAVALNASATAGGQQARLRPFVLLSIVFLVATTLLAASRWQSPVLALGAIGCSLWPGMLLLRHERAA